MPELNFTIDSHLFQELGERLVGRPYIALAELIKNAYDADANHCEILFLADEIQVWDDGHGMTFQEFRDFWMRIGTTNKQTQQFSHLYSRPLTGSKGIGRLAVQFLGKQVEIITSSSSEKGKQLKAEVDWEEAVRAGELTKAVARYQITDEQERYANGSTTGTKIVLRTLNHDWDYNEEDKNTPVRALAREVWMLRPPFAEATAKKDPAQAVFQVSLLSEDERMETAFRSQLDLVLEAWDAKIKGEIRDGRKRQRCEVLLSFRDGDEYEIAAPLYRAEIDNCSFEIRIFKLYGKQPGGIAVDSARAYFKEFGGVHVYDSAFRLPYYGIEQDWLGIQLDHSHRRSISSLLPSELNVPLAMHDLPTMERIFGAVNINTALELRHADVKARKKGEYLQINIGRDRLVDNTAYKELKRLVRWSIDYYATRFQLRQDREVGWLRPAEPPSQKLDRLWETINEISSELPKPVHSKLVGEIDDYYEALTSENRYVERQTSLLAPLAAAGMAALAFEHESNRQLGRLERLANKLSQFGLEDFQNKDALDTLCSQLRAWIQQNKRTRSLFASLTSKEDREDQKRFRAKAVVNIVFRNTRPLLRRVKTETGDIDDELLLPMGTMADWQAIFQNIFINASNAMLDSLEQKINVTGGKLTTQRWFVKISDTGVGANLADSKELFEPFVRRLEISDERKSLGLGGMGLGLTIVRMICETRRLGYGFVEPEPGFATSFQLTWTR